MATDLGTIVVQVTGGGRPEAMPVRARIGAFVVHGLLRKGDAKPGHRWVIMHERSGLRACTVGTLVQAREVIEQLLAAGAPGAWDVEHPDRDRELIAKAWPICQAWR